MNDTDKMTEENDMKEFLLEWLIKLGSSWVSNNKITDTIQREYKDGAWRNQWYFKAEESEYIEVEWNHNPEPEDTSNYKSRITPKGLEFLNAR